MGECHEISELVQPCNIQIENEADNGLKGKRDFCRCDDAWVERKVVCCLQIYD